MTQLFNACEYLPDRRLAAGDRPRLALTGPAGELTYARLHDRVRRIAAGLRADGVAELLTDSRARFLAVTREFAGIAAEAAAAAPELAGILADGAMAGAPVPVHLLDSVQAGPFGQNVSPRPPIRRPSGCTPRAPLAGRKPRGAGTGPSRSCARPTAPRCSAARPRTGACPPPRPSSPTAWGPRSCSRCPRGGRRTGAGPGEPFYSGRTVRGLRCHAVLRRPHLLRRDAARQAAG